MFYILTAVLIGSSTGVIVRLSGIEVRTLVMFSSMLAAVLMGLFFLRTEPKENISLKKVIPLLLMGVITLVNSLSTFYSYQYTTFANAVLTHYTAPVFVALLAPVFLKERLDFKLAVAIVTATSGLWILLDISAEELFDLILAGDKNTVGIIAGLISGVAYAFMIITFRAYSHSYHPLVLNSFRNAVVAFLLIPFCYGTSDMTVSGFWAVAVMGIVHLTVGPLLYLRGIRTVTANRAAILGYLEPVSVILLGSVFFGEAISLRTFIGGLMILFSGYLTVTGQVRSNKATEICLKTKKEENENVIFK